MNIHIYVYYTHYTYITHIAHYTYAHILSQCPKILKHTYTPTLLLYTHSYIHTYNTLTNRYFDQSTAQFIPIS